jgi:hypothetical protein
VSPVKIKIPSKNMREKPTNAKILPSSPVNLGRRWHFVPNCTVSLFR